MRDYAHSPDGVEKVLESVGKYISGRVICLIGCGGDRDKLKRPLMGKIAHKYSDLLIVTSDNPRGEEPDAIIDDIIAGLDGEKPYIRITDRRTAIERAVSEAQSGDMVLLLGKGHETYQIIGGEYFPFDEKVIVNEIMKN
jgi:UDP-N-acetylmuramoyl-L-alanyl-D-glutamate--2,6-diaminopimelate ligase